MQPLQDFLNEWDLQYASTARTIPLFDQPSLIEWTARREKLFARLFYHSRGHFDRFLWIMASLAPSADYRSVVIRNITDELGGIRPADLSHEQLFFRFAEELDPDIRDEPRVEGHNLPFLRAFNEGHIKALLNADWDGKWAIFSAYELLDNTDYNNLSRLAQSMGLSGEALVFFDVHRNGDHFGETFQLLEGVWARDPQKVRTAFDFIGTHQIKMWREMSDTLAV